MLKKIVLLFFISNFSYGTEFLVIQSTTSTSDSGFYDFILPIYEEKTGVDIRVVAVGTGQAIKNAMNGDGDLLIVHSEEDEKNFILNGYGVDRRKLMYKHYIKIGPKNQPETLREKAVIKEEYQTITKKK